MSLAALYGGQKVSDNTDLFLVQQAIKKEVAYNMCEFCKIPMEFRRETDQYCCPTCRLIKDGLAVTSVDATQAKNTGGCRVQYTGATNYESSNRKKLIDELKDRNMKLERPFPVEIIRNAVDYYCDISRCDNGKRYTKRGHKRANIIGAIFYYLCLDNNCGVTKRFIADFMQLDHKGLSEGIMEVYRLINKGMLNIKITSEKPDSFAKNYLEALGLDKTEYIDFVVELVETGDRENVGQGPQMSSKIVGAIRFLIRGHPEISSMGITDDDLIRISNLSKKTTFDNYYQAVLRAVSKFRGVFTKYGVLIVE